MSESRVVPVCGVGHSGKQLKNVKLSCAAEKVFKKVFKTEKNAISEGP